jgi:toxin YoeB
MNKKFTDEAWNDYQYWAENDKKLLKRINLLIKDIDRDPFEGIGKLDPIKAELWNDYQYWAESDRKLMKRINLSIKDNRKPCGRIGKPEPLKADLQGYWSRRIDSEHRIIYTTENIQIVFISFRFHYE